MLTRYENMTLSSIRSVRHANRIRRAQPRQPAALRTDRACPEDREEPDRLGLARADRLPQGRGPAGGGTVAAASGAAARPRLRIAARGGTRPRIAARRVPAGICASRPGILTRVRRTPGGSMYPTRFRYEAPRSLDEAISTLRDGGDYAKVLAGGQSLVPMMKLRFASPELVVDINNVPGLDYHRAGPDGTLRIGALCRHADLERSGLLTTTQPTMAAASPLIADPIVRNRGTLVGSLCHADPQGDWASVVLALGGSVVARGPNGRRAIAVADFVTGPFENTLEPDEIAVEAVIPAAQGTRAGGYLKLERRVGDFATVGVAVAIETSGATVTRAGIALTGVGGSTVAATEAAGALTGKPLTPETIEQAAELAAQAANPRTDHRGSAEYKRHMVRTFVVRLLSRDGDSAERAA